MLLPPTASPWPPWPEVEWLSRLAGLEGAGVVRRGGLAPLSPWNDAYKGGSGAPHSSTRSAGVKGRVGRARVWLCVRCLQVQMWMRCVCTRLPVVSVRVRGTHVRGTSGGVPFTSSACRAASAAASTAAALALAARDAGDWPSLLACAHMRGRACVVGMRMQGASRSSARSKRC